MDGHCLDNSLIQRQETTEHPECLRWEIAVCEADVPVTLRSSLTACDAP